MPRENKSLAVVRRRIAEALVRREAICAEVVLLTAIERELSAVKPKRAVKVKAVRETLTGSSVE